MMLGAANERVQSWYKMKDADEVGEETNGELAGSVANSEQRVGASGRKVGHQEIQNP